MALRASLHGQPLTWTFEEGEGHYVIECMGRLFIHPTLSGALGLLVRRRLT